METILILPQEARGNLTITDKAWNENHYTIEGVGRSVQDIAISLGIGMTMEIYPGTFGGYFIKWYPSEEDNNE